MSRSRSGLPIYEAARLSSAYPIYLPHVEEDNTIETQQLTQHVVRILHDKKALDIVVLDVEGRTSYCDRIILCTGTSARQVRALAEHVARSLRDEQVQALGIEGLEGGHWVLLDLGHIVLHVFDEASRAHYNLEGLWADASHIPLESLGIAAEPEMAPFLS